MIAESGGSGDGKVRPVVYKISAKLLDNSWPLRPDQLRAMCYYKEHLPSILDKQTGLYFLKLIFLLFNIISLLLFVSYGPVTLECADVD